jgi:hypothetical protein
MTPMPSLLSEEQFLVYVVGPLGGAAVVPTREQIAASNARLDNALAPYEGFEAKGSMILGYVQQEFGALQQRVSEEEHVPPDEAQETYTQAASMVLWLVWNDPRTEVVENREKIEWMVFGIVDDNLMVQFGDGDNDFVSTRDKVVDMYAAEHGVTFHEMKSPPRESLN